MAEDAMAVETVWQLCGFIFSAVFPAASVSRSFHCGKWGNEGLKEIWVFWTVPAVTLGGYALCGLNGYSPLAWRNPQHKAQESLLCSPWKMFPLSASLRSVIRRSNRELVSFYDRMFAKLSPPCNASPFVLYPFARRTHHDGSRSTRFKCVVWKPLSRTVRPVPQSNG